MAEKQMIIGVEFPTWDTLSTPVKSLISFMMEDASAYFKENTSYKNVTEENPNPELILTGSICNSLRLTRVNSDYDHYANTDIIYGIQYRPLQNRYDSESESDSIDSLGLFSNYNTDVIECNSELNLYIASNAETCSNMTSAKIAKLNCNPISSIPVTIKPWLTNENNKLISVNKDKNIQIEFNAKSDYRDNENDNVNNDILVANINANNESQIDYQLRTKSIKVQLINGSSYSEDSILSDFSMFYKIGICPLDHVINNCFWKSVENSTEEDEEISGDYEVDVEFNPTVDEEEPAPTIESLKTLLKSKKFAIYSTTDTNPMVTKRIAIIDENDKAEHDSNGEFIDTYVSYVRDINFLSSIERLRYNNFLLKNKYVIPIYYNNKLYGVTYLKAFYDQSNENESIRGEEVPNSALDPDDFNSNPAMYVGTYYGYNLNELSYSYDKQAEYGIVDYVDDSEIKEVTLYD